VRTGGPIFVVGVARSGTTLARTVLQGSGQVAIAAETHFVGHVHGRRGVRAEFRRLGDLTADATLLRIVDLIYSGELARRIGPQPYFRWLVNAVDRARFEARLLQAERSDRGIFQLMLDLYAERKGMPRTGEKTPAHVRQVDTLLEWFPDARVVHMVRDPRAIYVSELRRRERDARFLYRQLSRVPAAYASYVLVKTTILWADAADRDAGYSERHPGRYRRQRFEDLVQRPEDEIAGLFDFLGLELTQGALDQKVVSVGFKAGEQGFDAGAATRWREQISPVPSRWLGLTLGSRMRRLGYDSATSA
jgi:hypothetical protein